MRTVTTTPQASLREQIRTVRESILSIVVRMDDITLQRIPQIRTDYALKIGCWEQALLEAELAGRRAHRRLQLAQARANRGDVPNMDAIERQLDSELAEWMDKVERGRIAYEQAIAYLTSMTPMSKRSTEELKKTYRVLAKRLHPDVCAGSEKKRAALFMLAQSAYRKGDVEMLRSLEVATRHMDASEDDLETTDDVGLLAQELELARIEEGVMLERLHDLENSTEMRLAQMLADPEWLTAQTNELRRAVEEWERVRKDCDARLKRLRENHHEH